MEQRYPKYMSDAERVQLALDLLDEAFSALCWVGAGPPYDRPARVQKGLDRLDKTITSLEKLLRDGSK